MMCLKCISLAYRYVMEDTYYNAQQKLLVH